MFQEICVILSTFLPIYALRSPESWDLVFRSNARSSFQFNTCHIVEELIIVNRGKFIHNSFIERQSAYTEKLHPMKHHPFVIKFADNCGQPCHESLEEKLLSIDHSNYYGIVSSEHALIYATPLTLQRLHVDHSDFIIDSQSFLPELKIDGDIDISRICRSSADVGINLNIFPMESRVLSDFIASITESMKMVRLNQQDVHNLIPLRENLLRVIVPCETAESDVHQIAGYSEVQWIEETLSFKFKSKWANPLTQSGKPGDSPLFAANITGIGQVIGIADTGLDYQSCFFSDDNVTVVANKLQLHHRKIVYYGFSDGGDFLDASGHGTLVSGVAAGKCFDKKWDIYNGAAYDAKLSFLDIGVGDSQTVTPPANHYSGIFTVLYNNGGARVQSMSWGSGSSSYTTQARYDPRFMHLYISEG
jgi:hypothetical protein